MVVIGFMGKKGSGKDTCADYLVDRYNFKKDAFANPLKDICRIAFSFTDEQLYGDKKEVVDERWNVKPREVLQFVGTELFRDQLSRLIPNIGNNFWVESLIARNGGEQRSIAIADLRFQNEVDAVHRMDGIVVKIARGTTKNKIDIHSSEIGLDQIEDYDFFIENNGTVDDLYNSIDLLVQKIKK